MNASFSRFVAGREDDDQPLTEAARVALAVDPTPRMIKMRVSHDGTPSEIPADAPADAGPTLPEEN
jgi:hypothetical protein